MKLKINPFPSLQTHLNHDHVQKGIRVCFFFFFGTIASPPHPSFVFVLSPFVPVALAFAMPYPIYLLLLPTQCPAWRGVMYPFVLEWRVIRGLVHCDADRASRLYLHCFDRGQHQLSPPSPPCPLFFGGVLWGLLRMDMGSGAR